MSSSEHTKRLGCPTMCKMDETVIQFNKLIY
jgi:hypothetical protein